jgi:hypothetical protein
MFNIIHYRKHHLYNWNFGHQSQHEQYDDVCLKVTFFFIRIKLLDNST